MMQLVEANWPILLAALLIGLLVAWLVLRTTRKTTIARDADAEAADAPAKRNQALIDAEPASKTAAFAAPVSAPDPAAVPGALAGAGIAASAAIPMQETAPEPEPEPEETPAPAPTPEPAPVPAPAPAPASTEADDLTRIKGVGPKLATLLGELGVSSFAQIAGWSDADIDRVDALLGRFQGRIRRDDWVKQAGLLNAGDIAGYEAQFGRL